MASVYNLNPSTTSTPINQWQGVKWTALGTSVTAGLGSAYTAVLNTLFGTTIQNLGVNSATLSPAGNGNGNIAAQIPNIAADAELVSIELINDFRLNVPLGTIADTTTATFYGALYKAVNDILAVNPSRKILLLTPYGDNYQQGYFGYLTPNSTGAFWWQYCKAITDTAKRLGVYCCDVATNSGIGGYNVGQTFSVDGIHLNLVGATQYANVVYKCLLAIQRYVPAVGVAPVAGWTFTTAVIGDLSGTRLTPTSIDGSNVAQYAPPTSGFAVLWLASGANNAAEWQVQDAAQYYNIAFGEGDGGWSAYGFYKNGAINSGGEFTPPRIAYSFTAVGGYAGQQTIAATNPYSTATKYRAARIGNRIVFEAFVASSWVNVFDRLFDIAVAESQKTTLKIGLLVYSNFMSVSNVRVGTLA